ncbi:MAG: histidinol dehydrogenase [Acidiferrobacterales bacterium]|nr:histidinol dehydrogenase [Acidiferrobacterales bacterium]
MPDKPIMIKRLNAKDSKFSQVLADLLNRNQVRDPGIDEWVRQTIEQVAKQGDPALFDFTEQFDGFELTVDNIEISKDQLQQSYDRISSDQREALEYAAQRVRDYHQRQLQESWSYQEADGTQLGQKVTPLARVGLYVPGGKATYPSSVLMNAIPAKVAGVKELIMTSPTPNGEINDMVFAAAYIAKIDRVFRIGGAQAIAALAYGTESVPAVDKITGPGNIYVATAKQQVFGKVGIDMIAGPSEVLIIADAGVDPDWVAMDLFAQAEHDEIAQSILLTDDPAVADAVEQSINRLLPGMERAAIISKSLSNNGALIVVESNQELVDVADTIAAEHLEIFHKDVEQLTGQISNAGAIFMGSYSAESLGDYCAGPSHVLPTSGTARFSSPLGVYDFQKRTSIINVSQQGAQTIGAKASVLARGESLTAHARSAEYRLTEKE